MNLKNILLFFIILFTINTAFSQNNSSDSGGKLSKYSFKERLRFNLGGGIWFGTLSSNVNIQPQLGYMVTNKLIAGIGGNFQYFKNTYYSNTPFLIYGGNIFTRYKLSTSLFAQAEYQVLAFNHTIGDYAMIGGGYMPGGGFYISAYYLVLYPPNNNLYGAPYVVRVGYMF